MNSAGFFKGMVMCLAAWGVCLSGAAFAGPPAHKPVVRDVALTNDGALVGKLVDAQGLPLAGVDVTLVAEQQPLGTRTTSREGVFTFRGVRGGIYQLTGANGAATYRLWAPGTAPKGTGSMALLTAGEAVVRGQYYGANYSYGYQQGPLSRAKFYLANPWVVSGIAATAVAVPVGIANADEGDVPASP